MDEKYQIQLLKESPLFDADWYTEQYPDVKNVKLTAEQHYLRYGWRMGRNPSASFSGGEYQKSYPDVVQKSENPLIHYLRFGRHEGREVQPVTQRARNLPIRQGIDLGRAPNRETGGAQPQLAEAVSNQLNETQRLLEKYVRRCHELEYQLMDGKEHN